MIELFNGTVLVVYTRRRKEDRRKIEGRQKENRRNTDGRQKGDRRKTEGRQKGYRRKTEERERLNQLENDYLTHDIF